jgi:hypothetical protein
LAPSPDAEAPIHEASLFEAWSPTLSQGDRVWWVLEHPEARFVIEEVLPTEHDPKIVNIFRIDVNNHIEAISEHPLETILVLKPDEQSVWSYWLHRSIGLEEAQVLSFAELPYVPGSLKLKAAMHLPPDMSVEPGQLVFTDHP